MDINLNLGKSWEAKILFFEIRFWAFLGSFEKKNFFRFVRPYVPVIKLGTKKMASGGKPGKSHFILLRNSPEKSAKCLSVFLFRNPPRPFLFSGIFLVGFHKNWCSSRFDLTDQYYCVYIAKINSTIQLSCCKKSVVRIFEFWSLQSIVITGPVWIRSGWYKLKAKS